MKMRIYSVLTAALMTGSVYAATVANNQVPTGTEPMQDACSITCYEKTPTCYVTQDKDGCLNISDKKPVCKDNKCICEMSGCDKKSVIKLKN